MFHRWKKKIQQSVCLRLKKVIKFAFCVQKFNKKKRNLPRWCYLVVLRFIVRRFKKLFKNSDLFVGDVCAVGLYWSPESVSYTHSIQRSRPDRWWSYIKEQAELSPHCISYVRLWTLRLHKSVHQVQRQCKSSTVCSKKRLDR